MNAASTVTAMPLPAQAAAHPSAAGPSSDAAERFAQAFEAAQAAAERTANHRQRREGHVADRESAAERVHRADPRDRVDSRDRSTRPGEGTRIRRDASAEGARAQERATSAESEATDEVTPLDEQAGEDEIPAVGVDSNDTSEAVSEGDIATETSQPDAAGQSLAQVVDAGAIVQAAAAAQMTAGTETTVALAAQATAASPVDQPTDPAAPEGGSSGGQPSGAVLELTSVAEVGQTTGTSSGAFAAMVATGRNSGAPGVAGASGPAVSGSGQEGESALPSGPASDAPAKSEAPPAPQPATRQVTITEAPAQPAAPTPGAATSPVVPTTPPADSASRPEAAAVKGIETLAVHAPQATAPAQQAQPVSSIRMQPVLPLAEQLSGQLTSLRQLPKGDHILTLTVNPDSFGPVRVVAHIGADGVSLELFGASEQARVALRQALPDLRRDLVGTGLDARLDVNADAKGGFAGGQASGGQQGDARQASTAATAGTRPLDARATTGRESTTSAHPRTVRGAIDLDL